MEFLVRLGTPDGRVFEEVHRAADAGVLKGDLERRGLHIFEIRSKGWSLRPRLPAFARRRRIPPLTFLVFNQELAALLKAGLPLLQALELMLERLADPHFRSVLTDIRDRVKSGEDLSEAFAAYGEMFPALYSVDPQGRRAHRRARGRDPPLHPLPEAGARRAQEGDLGAGLSGGAGRPVDRDDRA